LTNSRHSRWRESGASGGWWASAGDRIQLRVDDVVRDVEEDDAEVVFAFRERPFDLHPVVVGVPTAGARVVDPDADPVSSRERVGGQAGRSGGVLDGEGLEERISTIRIDRSARPRSSGLSIRYPSASVTSRTCLSPLLTRVSMFSRLRHPSYRRDARCRAAPG